MIKPAVTLYRPGEPGTLGAVCNIYFDRPGHEDCPFRRVCCMGNVPVKDDITLRIVRNVDAETLEAMAKAIRSAAEQQAE